MKNRIAKILLLAGYCVPFVFLAMHEDVTAGTMRFYLVMIIGFGALCYGCIKMKSHRTVAIGNILSFASSCIFTYFFRTEKWGWYFKPFTPYQAIVFETAVASFVQILFSVHNKRKTRNTK